MKNFTYYVPTKVHFGKGMISHLSELAESGERVLLVYGGGSIKRMGIYDEAMKILEEAGLTVFELSGVEPNPKVELVRKGIDLCRSQNIDMVLAIGGGSVLDTAKAIAAGTCYEGNVWDLIDDSSRIKAALPIYTVLTLSATGSEMNKNAVLSDMSRNVKASMSSDLLKPRMSVCDPTYTFSLSKRQTAAGTAVTTTWRLARRPSRRPRNSSSTCWGFPEHSRKWGSGKRIWRSCRRTARPDLRGPSCRSPRRMCWRSSGTACNA